ncbi:MAG: Hsp33 family molecular chaperone HslO [Halothiobacillaceae bacterium]
MTVTDPSPPSVSEETDRLLRFAVAPGHVRGVAVSLDEGWRTVIEQARYPEPVARLLGEALAAATMMVATLKFEGRLVLQLRGDGPLNMMVVQVRSDRSYRALARWSGNPAGATLQELTGHGQLVLTIEPERGERYQSMVPLVGNSLSDALAVYFEQSEQLPTHFVLAADERRATGLMVQRMPGEGGRTGDGEPAEDWGRVEALVGTLSAEELLEHPVRTVLYRLFHEERVEALEQSPLQFVCGCSRQRVGEMIASLGAEEAQAALEDPEAEEVLRVDCDFCGQRYEFDAVDVAELFATDGLSQGTGSGRTQ